MTKALRKCKLYLEESGIGARIDEGVAVKFSDTPIVLWRLGKISNTFIIISPNKKPDCDNISGWVLVDEVLMDRIRMKVYCC